MTVREDLKKRSSDNLKKIKDVSLGFGWLTSSEISEKLGGEISSNVIGTIIPSAIKRNKFDCFVYCEYINCDRASWLFSETELPLKIKTVRVQALRHAVDEKKIICDHFVGKDWFFSHEVAELLDVSSKKAGGVMRSLNQFGFEGFIVKQKIVQVRWPMRCFKIDKDEPEKFEPTFLSKRWV